MKKDKEYIFTKQLMKSGTSISANIEEAQQAESRKDFVSKCSISMKEAYESRFWIRMLRDTSYIHSEQAEDHLAKLEEVIAMLGASIRTAKRRIDA